MEAEYRGKIGEGDTWDLSIQSPSSSTFPPSDLGWKEAFWPIPSHFPHSQKIRSFNKTSSIQWQSLLCLGGPFPLFIPPPPDQHHQCPFKNVAKFLLPIPFFRGQLIPQQLFFSLYIPSNFAPKLSVELIHLFALGQCPLLFITANSFHAKNANELFGILPSPHHLSFPSQNSMFGLAIAGFVGMATGTIFPLQRDIAHPSWPGGCNEGIGPMERHKWTCRMASKCRNTTKKAKNIEKCVE
jgi:hypothetical protein